MFKRRTTAFTSVLVLHAPLFLLYVPEAHRIVQTSSRKPFPVPREARREYWALIRVDSFQCRLIASQSSLLYVGGFQNTARQKLYKYAE